MAKFCTQCGNKLTVDSNFCSQCGEDVRKINQGGNTTIAKNDINNTNQVDDTTIAKNNINSTNQVENTIIAKNNTNRNITNQSNNIPIAKNERSGINPFTGKKHFDMVDDDKFLNQSYGEYYNIINQSQLLDETPDGQIVSAISLRLIEAVEDHLAKIGRLDYTENYYDWEFHLILSDTVNAFCMPGGKIVMFSGMLSVADNEQAVAFILAHEMAHALLDHSRTQISTYNAKNTITTASRIGAFGLGMIGLGGLGSLVRTATDVADIGSEYLLMKPFSRSHELEADKLGMMIASWAGYDISQIPNFWERMSAHSSNNHDFFSTHPSDSKRIEAMNKLVIKLSNQKDFHSSPVL